MIQLSLPFPPEQVPGLTCVFGEPWPHLDPCPKCTAENDRLEAEFWRQVAAGKYNPGGYTLKEWIKAGRTREDWQSGACGLEPPHAP